MPRRTLDLGIILLMAAKSVYSLTESSLEISPLGAETRGRNACLELSDGDQGEPLRSPTQGCLDILRAVSLDLNSIERYPRPIPHIRRDVLQTNRVQGTEVVYIASLSGARSNFPLLYDSWFAERCSVGS